MTANTTKAITISKNNAGFPDYLDFTRLRTEGIDYLGKLSGKIWSDHNLHDPGITIFEELCYALLDLGYRTNLPVADILAKDPASPKPEDNFFTPAQILTNNPLTINDYRKLLIDIPGIRNAWLQPARDIKDICRPNNPNTTGTCEQFLNGIYHVFIETEKDVDRDFENEDPAIEEADKEQFIKQITGEVRKVLMAHRNLCEDFADIYILCKLETGVCATIEIENGANAEEVYMNVANRLRAFFSPTPRFYTLDQLLNKGYSMDEAFAGRPFSKQSHGFIDTAELESITLKKEIHTSDIYHEIFNVEGVRKVSRLKFRSCGKQCLSTDGKTNSDWIFHLPQNHVPVFSLSCSGFEFTMNGLPVTIDQDKFNSQLELGWLYNGKILYKMPSPYLDAPLPQGVYHPELGEHYSIMHDFPAVYGIGEGDLPDDASDLRKAQMLQLRGYLMFFDQMLANYLSQLQNVRQLFSFAHPVSAQSQHTYFLNNITSIPEMDKLLRFGAGNGLGPAGTVLAYPVDKSTWDTTVFTAQPAATLLAGFSPYTFTSLYSVYESTDLLMNDLINEGESTVVTQQAQDLKWLYAIVSSTGDFVMIGNKVFDTEEDAQKHASSVQYAGVFEKNYRSFITGGTQFTFDLELNLITYTDYLGILVEDEELYEKRRTGFLTHLLSRFAEQFTDFVIYNWKSAMGVTDIYAAEQYLLQYPDLSRNRGKAFNYQLDSLINYNVSGFEKKVKAIAGIYSGKKNYGCPFVVEPFDDTYFFDPLLKGGSNINKIADRDAGAAAERLGYVYRLVDKEHLPAFFSMPFTDKATALGSRHQLAALTRDLINQIPIVLFNQDLLIETNPGQYPFIIPVKNLGSIPGDLVLFQGIKIYNSKQEAIDAFNNNLIDVLTYGAATGSYGDYIIYDNQPATANTIVRIPAATQTTLENTWGAGWLNELIKVLSLYPFRKIDITSIPYAELYCKEYTAPAPGAADDPANIKYYFNLRLDDKLQGNWISTTHFETKEEAFEEFAFFQLLAGYAGNYFADCACTGSYDNGIIYHTYSFKLFIREVLAQSTDVFATIEDAWGPKGIEKFICAAQGEKAFWTYQRNKACFSFYGTCGQGSLQHPCQYDSEKEQEKALEALQEQAKAYIENNAWSFNGATGELFNKEGKPFARINLDKIPSQDRCDIFVRLAELILAGNKGNTTYTANGYLEHSFPNTQIVIRSTENKPQLTDEEKKQWIEAWEKELRTWACLFPIVRTKLKTNKGEPEQFKYCLEIKFPGYNDCGNDRKEKNNCTVAWKSTCCYATCYEALAALEPALKMLADKKNYRAVIYCEDNSYGIALHSFHPSIITSQKPAPQSDIIAINPQCYPTIKEDCQAVERAKRLINMQGMHLIEHILLRPFKEEDCRCRRKLAACGTDCDFPHWVQEDFGCAGKEINVCFKPGTDPYSFIATVFLPAWSKRFRDEKERLLFEQLLYREAPAHVLLRIIWLRPIDFCRLESTYFQWEKWMAGLTNCNVDFNACNFIDLLFSTYYECLPACVDCQPCKDPTPPKQTCWDEKDRVLRPLGFIDQINEIYCFEDYCGRKQGTGTAPTKEPVKQPKETPKEAPKEAPPKRKKKKDE
ncbi:hypothetical protein A3860_32700 [Niastella vici]|uniref:Uncharacterized protein n=1 Tax=Niastella vici TaxID=1703345 RepID=A0A1V9FQQ2_9BACT|nr:hypothetical protein [Niastella vici]OQP60576.1 hypothetical protein A3860_32700 [Niastella vici]